MNTYKHLTQDLQELAHAIAPNFIDIENTSDILPLMIELSEEPMLHIMAKYKITEPETARAIGRIFTQELENIISNIIRKETMQISVKLNITERINVLSILPDTGNYTTLSICKLLVNTLEIKPQEKKSIGIIETPLQNGQIKYKYQDQVKAKKEQTFKLSPEQIKLIKEKLDNLSKANSLTMHQISLYDKFVKQNPNK